ncbi:hypothetical protein GE21DRAFT_1050047 [Neurospora crassa]|nr:hypothetical protein GE21DRAFT_1050047 [Neurospora crassa]
MLWSASLCLCPTIPSQLDLDSLKAQHRERTSQSGIYWTCCKTVRDWNRKNHHDVLEEGRIACRLRLDLTERGLCRDQERVRMQGSIEARC